MGSYNIEYEGYYKTLRTKIKNKFKHKNNINSDINLGSGIGYRNLTDKSRNMYRGKRKSISIIPRFGLSNPGRTIIIQLSGTLLLFVAVIVCKTIRIPETINAYEYGKKIVSENYDYKNDLDYLLNYDYKNNLKNFKIEDINSYLSTYFNKVKVKIEEFTSAKDVLEKNFIIPCNKDIVHEFNEKEEDSCLKKEYHKGIDIAGGDSDIVATNSGKIKEIGYCDEDKGEYLIIDHGNGVESKYYFLKEVNVDINKEVNAGEVIGKGCKTKDEKDDYFHFEITYMGEEKNPLEFIKN